MSPDTTSVKQKSFDEMLTDIKLPIRPDFRLKVSDGLI